MNVEKSCRGFEFLVHPRYVPPHDEIRLASQSSACGDDEEAMPGASFLWIGDDHHLSREQVEEFRDRLTAWLETGSLRLPSDGADAGAAAPATPPGGEALREEGVGDG